MGMMRNLPDEIQVIFSPDEIVAERFGMYGDSTARVCDVIVFVAQRKVAESKLKDIPIGGASLTFENGNFVIRLKKEKDYAKKDQDRDHQ